MHTRATSPELRSELRRGAIIYRDIARITTMLQTNSFRIVKINGGYAADNTSANLLQASVTFPLPIGDARFNLSQYFRSGKQFSTEHSRPRKCCLFRESGLNVRSRLCNLTISSLKCFNGAIITIDPGRVAQGKHNALGGNN